MFYRKEKRIAELEREVTRLTCELMDAKLKQNVPLPGNRLYNAESDAKRYLDFIYNIAKLDPTIKERFFKDNPYHSLPVHVPDIVGVSDFIKMKAEHDKYAELKKKFGVK